MARDIRKIENYDKMIKFFEQMGIKYRDFYEYDEKHDYTESVLLIVGMDISPIRLNIEIHQEEDVVVFSFWISIRATKFMFEGDVSDCTDLISSIMTIIINSVDNYELSLTDMFNPTYIDAEIYGRIITFLDPDLINADFESNNFIEKLERIISLCGLANMIMCKVINMEAFCNDFVNVDEEEYEIKMKNIFGEDFNSSACNYIKRKNEDWEWVYNDAIGISSINFKKEICNKLLSIILDEEIDRISGINRDIICYKSKIYAIDKEKFEYAKKILRYYGENRYTIIAIRNKFFVISEHNIISISDECGFSKVMDEKKLIRERRRLENKILFGGELSFEWNDKIDGGRFEDLIRDMLSKEMYISRIRKAGPTNQPDNGLDLIIEYIDFNNQKCNEGEKPFQIKKIIGQCKAYKGTVGKGDVTDIRDTLDYYDAQGYWLFVSSQISVHLSEYLQKLRDKDIYLIDWWNRAEIEEVLRNYPEIIESYKDVIKIKEEK